MSTTTSTLPPSLPKSTPTTPRPSQRDLVIASLLPAPIKRPYVS